MSVRCALTLVRLIFCPKHSHNLRSDLHYTHCCHGDQRQRLQLIYMMWHQRQENDHNKIGCRFLHIPRYAHGTELVYRYGHSHVTFVFINVKRMWKMTYALVISVAMLLRPPAVRKKLFLWHEAAYQTGMVDSVMAVYIEVHYCWPFGRLNFFRCFRKYILCYAFFVKELLVCFFVFYFEIHKHLHCS